MDIQGYCIIKNNSTSGISAEPISEFENQFIRVIEFAQDGGVLVLNPKGTGLGTFNKEDVKTSFKCEIWGNVVCPPGLDMLKKMLYSSACYSRKGGYNDTISKMVIAGSLMKGRFEDSVLWQCGNTRPPMQY